MSTEKTNEILIDDVKVEKKEQKKVEKKEQKKIKPSLFFKKDSKIEISVDGYHSNETGELQFVLLSNKNEKDKEEEKETKELEKLFTKINYKFWFSRIPYDKLNRYRSRSMIYNSEDQNNTINELKLREFFLVFHLVDWDLKDENDKKIELKFDTNGALSDETLNLIYELPSILIDTVLTSFERKMAIS